MAVLAYTIGHLTLYPHRELLDGGSPVAIGGRALDLLSTLAAADSRVVSKDELLASVWGGAIVEENALQAQVSAVRRALGSEAARLVTVHGRGYRLELGRRTTAAPGETAPSSVVVFAYENLSGQSSNDYLCDGMAEELVASLAFIPDLLVPALGPSMAFRGSGVDLRALAREMGVATVLDGSLRAAQGRLQLTLELVEVASGAGLWSREFEGEIGNLLALHDEMVEAVAAALGRRAMPRAGGPTSSESMRLVLQAIRMIRTIQVEPVNRAAELARTATILDPGYARAWSTLSGALYQIVNNGLGSRSMLDQARGHAEHALALDPFTSGAQSVLGILGALAGDWVSSAENLAKARELEPLAGIRSIALALNVPLPAGRITDASQMARECNVFPAARGYPSLVRALCASLVGDFERARQNIDAALLSGDPPRLTLFGMVQSDEAYARGAFDEALSPILASVARAQGSPETEQTMRQVFAAFAGKADRVEASEAAMRLFAAGDRSGAIWRNPDSAGPIVRWQARLGNLDAAFAVARRIVERWRESGLLANTSLIPFWAFDMVRFRSDPRFQEIVGDLGLFTYWERYGPPDGHVLRDRRLVVL